jgi:hypothetical protein
LKGAYPQREERNGATRRSQFEIESEIEFDGTIGFVSGIFEKTVNID